MKSLPWIILGFAGLAILLVNYLLHRWMARRVLREAREESSRLLEEANRDARTLKRETELDAKDRLETAERGFEEKTRTVRKETEARQRRLDQREKNLDRKASLLSLKQKEVEDLQRDGESMREKLEMERAGLSDQVNQERVRLERIAGMHSSEAKRELMQLMESEARQEAAQTVKRIQEEAREGGEEEARRILATCLQRVPSREINDSMICAVPLPNEEMKGRIIGREGRNIRALEMNTGVDIIVDETPGAILLSTFDPLRREMARLSVEKLIEDGRIHPARIEEVTAKVRSEFEQKILEVGETAAFELGLPNLHPKLSRFVGTLKYHGRVGQNLLDHSLEVALLGQALALELDADTETVKRAGLIHEVGHVAEPVSGTPPLLQSAELAARFNEPEAVVDSLRALSRDVDPRSIEAVLLQVADEVSLHRPGARKVKVETQVTRLRRLEDIARSFSGVRTAYAIRAGKEIRVIVESESITDSDVIWLSKHIAGRITADQVCTGHVRVSVIRETRAVDFAL